MSEEPEQQQPVETPPEPQPPEGDKKARYIDMVIAQCPMVTSKCPQTSGSGDAFRNYLKRIGKWQAFLKIKTYMKDQLGMRAGNAWVSAAMRFGWFELWTEEKAAKALDAQIAARTLVGHELYALPRNQWETYVRKSEMILKLPNPLPYIPPPTNDGPLPQGKKERIEMNRAMQKELTKTSDPLADLEWAFNNLCRDGITLQDCPSGKAYSMWRLGRKNSTKLFDQWSRAFLAPLLKRDPEKEKREAELDADKKRTMALIDVLAATLGKDAEVQPSPQ